jgi:hypothetical protein
LDLEGVKPEEVEHLGISKKELEQINLLRNELTHEIFYEKAKTFIFKERLDTLSSEVKQIFYRPTLLESLKAKYWQIN